MDPGDWMLGPEMNRMLIDPFDFERAIPQLDVSLFVEIEQDLLKTVHGNSEWGAEGFGVPTVSRDLKAQVNEQVRGLQQVLHPKVEFAPSGILERRARQVPRPLFPDSRIKLLAPIFPLRY